MAIKVNNVTAIDDSRNVSAAGIATVGSGNSTITINGLTGIMSVGTGITMQGIPGNISIAGTLTAAGLNIPLNIVSVSPAIGATEVSPIAPIIISFNAGVSIATTGFLTLRTGSAGGPGIATFGVGQLNNFLISSTVLCISPPTSFPTISTIFPVIPNGLIKSTSQNFVGFNTTGANNYSFKTRNYAPGDSYEGGFLICKASPIRWVVSPYNTEVSRNGHNILDANTRAQQISGCTGWFVPSSSQLQNPGFVCRSFWGPSPCYSKPTSYWSSTPKGLACLYFVSFDTGSIYDSFKHTATLCVRSFRCVTY